MLQNLVITLKKLIIPFVLLIIVAGCTQPVSQFKLIQQVSTLNEYQHAVVTIEGEGLEITTQDGYSKTIEVLHEKISKALDKTGRFQIINEETDGKSQLDWGKIQNELSVNLLITEFRYVSGVKRWLMAVGAGEAVLGGIIKLKSKIDGSSVGEMSFLEKSGDNKGPFSDYTGKQINKVARLVIALMTTK